MTVSEDSERGELSGVTGQSLVTLAEQLRAVPARLGSTRLVVIDGPAGSGKTTLAELLAAELAAAVVHMDDLYDGWDQDLDQMWPRLWSEVLQPITRGEPARYHCYDWAAGEFNAWVEVPPPTILIVEGVGSAGGPVDDLGTIIWVEAPEDVRLERGIARDGAAYREHWLAWMAAEQEHFRLAGTRDRAAIIVDGTADLQLG